MVEMEMEIWELKLRDLCKAKSIDEAFAEEIIKAVETYADTQHEKGYEHGYRNGCSDTHLTRELNETEGD